MGYPHRVSQRGRRVGNPLTCYFYRWDRRLPRMEPIEILNHPYRVAIMRDMTIRVEGANLDELKEIMRCLELADGAAFVGVIAGGEEVRQELGGSPTWPNLDS